MDQKCIDAITETVLAAFATLNRFELDEIIFEPLVSARPAKVLVAA